MRPQPAPVRVSPEWLALREPADAAARAAELVDLALAKLPVATPLMIHDLGCGTGSMARWLAPRLPGTQHWIMHDLDFDLLAKAAADAPGAGADGSAVTCETRQGDVSLLTTRELAGASLFTASALLDMLTADELERLTSACVAAGCPALLTVSVVGRIDMTPADPLDDVIGKAFDDHQRRVSGDRRLLGPDAVRAAVDSFDRQGAEVIVRASPWYLGAAQTRLAQEWFVGWLGAACEQRPALTALTAVYFDRRMAELADGRLRVTVHHDDLLAFPR